MSALYSKVTVPLSFLVGGKTSLFFVLLTLREAGERTTVITQVKTGTTVTCSANVPQH